MSNLLLTAVFLEQHRESLGKQAVELQRRIFTSLGEWEEEMAQDRQLTLHFTGWQELLRPAKELVQFPPVSPIFS